MEEQLNRKELLSGFESSCFSNSTLYRQVSVMFELLRTI